MSEGSPDEEETRKAHIRAADALYKDAVATFTCDDYPNALAVIFNAEDEDKMQHAIDSFEKTYGLADPIERLELSGSYIAFLMPINLRYLLPDGNEQRFQSTEYSCLMNSANLGLIPTVKDAANIGELNQKLIGAIQRSWARAHLESKERNSTGFTYGIN